MAAEGEITPMPEVAIFADTQAEPASVYKWLDWLEKQLPFPVHRVSYGDLAYDNNRVRVSKAGNKYIKLFIPAFLMGANGNRAGMSHRKCTRDYKILPIQRKLRELVGIKRSRPGIPVLAVQWIGISVDEADRMKPSQQPWLESRWPLIEKGISRQDCKDWMARHGYPEPPRSACIFCPYRSDAEWLRLRQHEPLEFARAAAWEKQMQKRSNQVAALKALPFLHDSLRPLARVRFSNGGTRHFSNECEGLCGN